jgi:hypothetical protein
LHRFFPSIVGSMRSSLWFSGAEYQWGHLAYDLRNKKRFKQYLIKSLGSNHASTSYEKRPSKKFTIQFLECHVEANEIDRAYLHLSYNRHQCPDALSDAAKDRFLL